MLTKARDELQRHLAAARQEPADRLRLPIKEGAPTAAIANALTDLAYVRHPKGRWINRTFSPVAAFERPTLS